MSDQQHSPQRQSMEDMLRRSHSAGCRAAMYHGTRFEADWPRDPERCTGACQEEAHSGD